MCVLVLLSTLHVTANQPVLELDQDTIASQFGPHVWLATDVGETVTPEQVANATDLQPFPDATINLGDQQDPAWLRIRVSNTTSAPASWVM